MEQTEISLWALAARLWIQAILTENSRFEKVVDVVQLSLAR